MSRKKKLAGPPLCLIDTKSGGIKRYVRAEAPRYAGDIYMVRVTDTVEVVMKEAGKHVTEIDRFRTNPEFFVGEE